MNEINEKLKEFFANETNARLVNSIIAVIICFAIYKVILLYKVAVGWHSIVKNFFTLHSKPLCRCLVCCLQ